MYFKKESKQKQNLWIEINYIFFQKFQYILFKSNYNTLMYLCINAVPQIQVYYDHRILKNCYQHKLMC